MNLLICTVGTSLINHWKDQTGNLGDEAAIRLVKELKKLSEQERRLGAEISSIGSLAREGKLTEGDRLYLCVSETQEGEFTGDVLKRYYQGRFEVEIKRIDGLQGVNPKKFQAGLRRLVETIAKIKREHPGTDIAINATGGYKAQISFAALIGQVFSIPVYYQFEGFPSHIVLPPMPVSWDFDRWLAHYELLEDAHHGTGNQFLKCTDHRYRALPEEMRVLFEDEGEDVALSAVGMLFHEGFKERFWRQSEQVLPPDCGIAVSEKKITYEDGNAGRHPGLEPFLKKVLEVPYVTRINTWYYNPDLPERIRFRTSTHGEDRVEGWYSDGKATTKFDVYLTSGVAKHQRQAAVVHLNEQFAQK